VSAFTLSSRAEQDITEIADYLARESLDAAVRFYDQVPVALSSLARNPGMGKPVLLKDPTLTGVRIWRIDGFPRVLVFYHATQRGIRVVRVLHGARDIDSTLGRM
jgi:toxin ParE1/3/4